MSIRLSTLNLEVAELQRSKAFYMHVLGMDENTERSHPPTFAFLESSTCALTLTVPHEAPVPQPSPTMELGFETDDLDAVAERLRNAGIEARDNSMGWGRALELCDPDGYRIVVFQLAS